MWNNYLLGRKFILIIDYSGLKYLFERDKLNARKARWLVTLSEFDFKIRYIKGRENNVVNALRKRILICQGVAMIFYKIDLIEKSKKN